MLEIISKSKDKTYLLQKNVYIEVENRISGSQFIASIGNDSKNIFQKQFYMETGNRVSGSKGLGLNIPPLKIYEESISKLQFY